MNKISKQDFEDFYRNGRELAYVQNLASDDYDQKIYLEKPTDKEEANLVTSLVKINSGLFGSSDYIMHRPVLDLDIPHSLIESSTKGHSHLYLDIDLTWSDYERLLIVLCDLGIIQEGFYDSAVRNMASAVRLPWVKKKSN